MLERLWSVSLDSLKIKGLQEGDVLRIHLCMNMEDLKNTKEYFMIRRIKIAVDKRPRGAAYTMQRSSADDNLTR